MPLMHITSELVPRTRLVSHPCYYGGSPHPQVVVTLNNMSEHKDTIVCEFVIGFLAPQEVR